MLFAPPAWLANYGFVQVVDGWMLVRPPAWASGPVTTLSLSQITGVCYQILGAQVWLQEPLGSKEVHFMFYIAEDKPTSI